METANVKHCRIIKKEIGILSATVSMLIVVLIAEKFKLM